MAIQNPTALWRSLIISEIRVLDDLLWHNVFFSNVGMRDCSVPIHKPAVQESLRAVLVRRWIVDEINTALVGPFSFATSEVEWVD